MKLRMGNREKMVFGGIITIVFIALLHMMVFSRKAKKYEETRRSWQDSKSKVETLVSEAKNPNDVTKLENENKQMLDEFIKIVEELRIELPTHYLDSSPESIQKRHDEFLALIKTLLEMQSGLQTTKLTFLGEKGWDLPTKLPDPIRERPARLWDVISQLNQISQVLEVIGAEDVKQTQIMEYSVLLKEIGVDEVKINKLSSLGKELPFINRICHLQLIMKEKPEDVKFTDQDVMKLLRITYPDMELLKINKQLASLVELIQMADKHGVEEITQIFIMDQTIIKKPPEPGKESESAPGGAPVTPPSTLEPELELGGEFGPGAMEFGPGAMEFEPGAMEFEPGARRPGGAARPGTARQPQGPPPETIIAIGAPITIGFVASNLSATNYLYNIVNSSRTYELDSLNINVIPEREGIQQVFALVNTLVMVSDVVVDLPTIKAQGLKKPETAAASSPPGASSPAAAPPEEIIGDPMALRERRPEF